MSAPPSSILPASVNKSDDMGSVDAIDTHGLTPLMLALRRRGDDVVAVVNSLIERGANVQVVDPKTGNTVLHLICKAPDMGFSGYIPRDVQVLQALLAAGANPHVANKAGELPLHLCTFHQEMLQPLLDANVDVNAVDNEGNTAFHRSIFDEDRDSGLAFDLNAETAKTLIARGAKLELENEMGQKPLDVIDLLLAEEINDNGAGEIQDGINRKIGFLTDVVPAMVAQGGLEQAEADVIGGKLLLMLTSEFSGDNGEDIVDDLVFLLDNWNIDFNFTDPQGNTALQCLLLNENISDSMIDDSEASREDWILDIMEKMRTAMQDKRGRPLQLDTPTTGGGVTLLHTCAKLGYLKMMRRLVELHANPGCRTHPEGWTPLHIAAGKGHSQIVRWILEGNIVDHQALDANRQTALALAALENHFECVFLLTQRDPADLCRKLLALIDGDEHSRKKSKH